MAVKTDSPRHAAFSAVTASSRTLLSWLTALVCITAVLACVPISIKSRVQFVALPFILVALWRVRFWGMAVPRVVVALAAVGAISGAIIQFLQVNLAAGAFVVSTVDDQNLRQETKIYRDRLKRSIASVDDSLVGSYPKTIGDERTALRILERNRSLGGVIWGSARWMSVVLRQYPPLALSSFQEDSAARALLRARGVPDLLLVRSIPYVGMSHGQERSTVYFLGSVIRIWHEIPRVMSPGAQSGDFEGALAAALRTQARWTSRSHIALPLWLSGTVHLVRASEGAVVQSGELACAISQLREALAMFRGRDNPALEMAVRNNYALALLMQAEVAPEPHKLRKKAYRQLAAAMKLRSHDHKVGAIVAVNQLGLVQSRKEGSPNGRKK